MLVYNSINNIYVYLLRMKKKKQWDFYNFTLKSEIPDQGTFFSRESSEFLEIQMMVKT